MDACSPEVEEIGGVPSAVGGGAIACVTSRMAAVAASREREGVAKSHVEPVTERDGQMESVDAQRGRSDDERLRRSGGAAGHRGGEGLCHSGGTTCRSGGESSWHSGDRECRSGGERGCRRI